MRITILTIGSRGDVQPYVALGVGLQAAGHDVRLATHAAFEGLIRGHGLDFFPLVGNPRTVLETGEGQALLGSGSNPIRLVRSFTRILEPLMQECLAQSLEACEGTDAVIFTVMSMFGHWVAEKLRVPSFAAYYVPLTPTSSFGSTVLPVLPSWVPIGRGLYNRLTYCLGAAGMWWTIRAASNKARQEVLNLPPLSMWCAPWRNHPSGFPYLYGYSPAVMPKPRDWDQDKHVTGYWFLDQSADWQPSSRLADFLRSGPPPVYVGFGSMNNRNAEEVTDLVVQALTRARQRGILMTGWGGLAQRPLPDEIFPVESVPHDWVFPRTAAVVHHGGAGTTAAGMRAGVPSIVVPFMSDQPFWARRVYELGVGPRPIPRKRLTAERLEEAIRIAVTDQEMQRRAAALGERLRAEDGIGQAVQIINRYLPAERLVPSRVASYQPSPIPVRTH